MLQSIQGPNLANKVGSAQVYRHTPRLECRDEKGRLCEVLWNAPNLRHTGATQRPQGILDWDMAQNALQFPSAASLQLLKTPSKLDCSPQFKNCWSRSISGRAQDGLGRWPTPGTGWGGGDEALSV